MNPEGFALRAISDRLEKNEQSCFSGFFLGKKSIICRVCTLGLKWSSFISYNWEPDQLKKVRQHASTGFLTQTVVTLLITHHFIEFTSLTITTPSYHRPRLQGPNRHPATKIGSILDLRPNRNSLVPRLLVLPPHALLEWRILEAADQILFLELVLPEVKLTFLLFVKLGAEDNIARMRNLSHESNRH